MVSNQILILNKKTRQQRQIAIRKWDNSRYCLSFSLSSPSSQQHHIRIIEMQKHAYKLMKNIRKSHKVQHTQIHSTCTYTYIRLKSGKSEDNQKYFFSPPFHSFKVPLLYQTDFFLQPVCIIILISTSSSCVE